MQYWKRWIADYAGKTQGLTLSEHGAYCLLLDHYYAHEKPLPASPVALYRICGAMDDLERAAVDSIISRFFKPSDDGSLHNPKADEQIAWTQVNMGKKAESGRLGGIKTQQAKRSKFADEPEHPKGNGSSAWWRSDDDTRAKGKEVKLEPRRGETMQEYKDRIFAAIKAQKAAQQ